MADVHAAYIQALGPPEAITVGDLPDPVPRSGELLVSVLASAVNPVDTYVRSGAFPTDLVFPCVIGRDLVGEVLALGPALGPGSCAHAFAPGDWVWANSLGYDRRPGATAELAVVPADRAYRLPAGVDPLVAVAAAHAGTTAALALTRHAALAPGETLLVAGGNGALGSAAIQLGRLLGARVIACARGAAAITRCLELGAEEVVDSSAPKLSDRLAALAPAGVAVQLDASGAFALADAVRLAAVGGRVVVVAGQGREEVIARGALYTRDVSLRGFVISRASATELAGAASLVNAALGTGRLEVRIAGVLPLAEAAAAHRRVEESLAGRQPLAGRLLLDCRGSG